MLFANDGSAADILNFYAELYGDGKVMDTMRGWLGRQQAREPGLLAREVAETAARVNEQRERVVENQTGLVPDFSVPVRIYHGWAAACKQRHEEQGINLPNNGYECWDDPWHIERFKRLYPECVFKEAKRNARIVISPFDNPSPTPAAA